MDTKIINAENAPAAVGPYCHAVEAGDFVFTSGQIGLDPQTQELKEGVAAQTKQVLANLGAVLKASDLTLDNVIKTTVFLADINDFAEINEKADQEDIIADTKASVMEKIKEQQEKVKLAPIPEPEKKTPVICPCREM